MPGPRRGVGASLGASGSPSAAGVRRSIHRRSSARKKKPSTIQNVTKMSSIAVRDCTKLRFSVASSNPATNVQSALPQRIWAMPARRMHDRVPTSAADTRRPNGPNPNAFSPRPIIHLPIGGWTHDPTSHLSVRQNFSSELFTSHCAFVPPIRMQPAFG